MHVSINQIVSERSATFAINVPDLRTSYWLLKIAETYQQPIILQISERVLRTEGDVFVKCLIDQVEKFSVKVSIHIDHCKSEELCRDAIRWGVSSVLFDGSHLPFAENLDSCKRIVEFARAFGAWVEGEIAPIPGEEDGMSNSESLKPALSDTELFIKKSGIFSFAPFFGNFHGHYADTYQDFDLAYLAKVKQLTTLPIVIHGGSGMKEDLARSILHIGAGKINFSSDFKKALLAKPIHSTDPYHAACEVELAVRNTFENLRKIWQK